MSAFAFDCPSCGQRHAGSPSFAFEAPYHFHNLSAEQRAAQAHLTTDTCEIRHAGGVDRFVRVTLELPIRGVAESFVWGVWVSLSEASYTRYLATLSAPDEDEAWFGWFANRLPGYPDTLNLKCRVRPRAGNLRPWLELERDGHPLAEDLALGITSAEAGRLAVLAWHPTH